jgi:hypothetical protein
VTEVSTTAPIVITESPIPDLGQTNNTEPSSPIEQNFWQTILLQLEVFNSPVVRMGIPIAILFLLFLW